MSDNEAGGELASAEQLAAVEAIGDLVGAAVRRPDAELWCAAFLDGKAKITIAAGFLHVEPIGDDDGPSLSTGQYL